MEPSPYQQHRRYFSQHHKQQTLDELLAGYLKLTRSLHYKHDGSEDDLRAFLRFLNSQSITEPGQITPEAAVGYQETLLARCRASTCNARIGAARRFAEHLLRLGLLGANPFANVDSVKQLAFVPYVFSTEELSQICQLKLDTPAHRHRRRSTAFTHYCAYHTIYACGLRRAELINLDLEDVDFSERTLAIRDTKFGKERLIPFNDKVRANLHTYLRLRRERFPHNSSHAFFLTERGTRPSRHTLSGNFKNTLRKLRLYRSDRITDGVIYGSPRLHSLRHSFAVHRLLRWYRQGCDVNQKLPLLSTYMGHVKFEHTLVYLSICAATLREANARFAESFENLFALWSTQNRIGGFRHEL